MTAQSAPVGPKGEMCPITRYTYHSNDTEVLDAEGNKTIYRFDSNKRITSVELYDRERLYRVERYQWESSTGNLLAKRTEDGSGKLFLKEEYRYDKNQNAVEIKVGDDKESYSRFSIYSDDGFNLKLSESDDYGKKITYAYLPNTNLLSSELVWEGNSIRQRTFHFYDNCATLIKTIVDDGSSENPNDLSHVTTRKITTIKPRDKLPCFGLPEIVEEKTIDKSGNEILLSKVAYSYTSFGKVLKEDHYDNTGTFRYCIRNDYDERERLSATYDALGSKTAFTYDANNNLLTLSGPRADRKKEWTYDKANRPIKEKDNELVTSKMYDKLGRVISSTDESGFETKYEYDVLDRPKAIFYPDGSVVKKEYDVLGNVTKEIDGNGYETIKTYNFRGQVTSTYYPDGSKEFFTYRPDGRMLSLIDKNGAKTLFSYDIFGHPLREEVYSSTGSLLKTRSSIYSSFNLLTKVDYDGVMTRFSYDFSGRKIAEERATKKSLYFYDALCRLTKTEVGETAYFVDYDLLSRVIEKHTEDLSGNLIERENYAYDEMGNQTKIITSKGVKESGYNSRGQLVFEKDPLGHLTTITYLYPQGLTKIITHPKGIQSIQICDSRGREKESLTKNSRGEIIQRTRRSFDKEGQLVVSQDDVFNGTTFDKTIIKKWSYGPCHQLLTLTEAGIKKKSCLYDSNGRLKTIIKPDGTALEHRYDELGRLVRFFSSDFDYNYTYDPCDRLLSVEDTYTHTITQRTYNALGNMVQEQLASGLILKSGYTHEGKRSSLTLPDDSLVTYTYRASKLYQINRGTNTVSYSQRDLEGNIVEQTLPSNLGKITFERDALSRITTCVAPSYSLHIPADGYDELGNLRHLTFTDPQGTSSLNFTYDDLDQLTSADDHTYLFDSLNNPLRKDALSYTINELCQIVDESISYDANGNMIAYKGCIFKYDTQDRLISVKKGDFRIAYTYDPFSRRLSKTLYEKEIKVKTLTFLWDDQNEIGATENLTTLAELRILGEGFGAEIGSAVLFELNGKSYLPIYDYRGSPAVIIDLATKQPVETLRYTAFGEESAPPTLSPWRFSSKRYDPETGFLFFGRRYYSPILGRWITPDPQGFDDGPNLYAYLHNNPLTDFDLYGLAGVFNDIYDSFSRRTFHFNEPSYPRESLCRHDYSRFDDHYSNKSGYYSLERSSIDNVTLCFQNGMKTSYDGAWKESENISKVTGGCNVEGVYNASQNFLVDALRCFRELCAGKMTPACYELRDTWFNWAKNAPSGAVLIQLCHSEGCIQVRNTLRHTPEPMRQQIIVMAIAPGAYIDRGLCRDVTHYVSNRDIVPYFDIGGRSRCKDSIVMLEPHKDAKFFDHDFMSPTYTKPVKSMLLDYIDKYSGKAE